jgi:hypothetical protein
METPKTPKTSIWRGKVLKSKLEREWVDYFETLGLTVAYEPRSFSISGGGIYTPDLHITTANGKEGAYAEIKPYGYRLVEDRFRYKATKAIVRHTKERFILLIGPPEGQPMESLVFDADYGVLREWGNIDRYSVHQKRGLFWWQWGVGKTLETAWDLCVIYKEEAVTSKKAWVARYGAAKFEEELGEPVARKGSLQNGEARGYFSTRPSQKITENPR